MRFFDAKPTLQQFQWLVILSVYVILLLSLLPMDGIKQATVYAFIYTTFYSAIIYGNVFWLFPTLYKKGRVVTYLLAVIVFLLVLGILRAYITLAVYNWWFTVHAQVMALKAIISMTLSSLMIFLLSFVFRMAVDYFDLKQRSDQMMIQSAKAELDLLKSQVQPHFLFNTLNNIYYEAYLEAPKTAELIERLSNMMRYFVDESPKQEVGLAAEIAFIQNYIALEKIRLRFGIDLEFKIDVDDTIKLPPMLLMTFIENVFKHGVDKNSSRNHINISLTSKNDWLIYQVTNSIPDIAGNNRSNGMGLQNLRKRLAILYGDDFILRADATSLQYAASLNIPLQQC